MLPMSRPERQRCPSGVKHWPVPEELSPTPEGEGCHECSFIRDLPRGQECEARNNQGLSEETAQIQRLDVSSGAECSHRPGAGLVPCGVHERDVRSRRGDRHWRENTRCHSVLLSSPRSTCFRNTPSEHQSFKRLDGCSTPTTTPPSSNRSSGRHHVGDDRGGKAQLALRLFVQFLTYLRPG